MHTLLPETLSTRVAERTGRCFSGILRPLRLQGQSTAEYAVLAAIVVAALLAMQLYMRSGLQGKLRAATEQIGDQFSPGTYQGKFKTTKRSAVTESLYTGEVGAVGKGQSRSDAQAAITGVTITGITQTRESTATEQATGDLNQETLIPTQ